MRDLRESHGVDCLTPFLWAKKRVPIFQRAGSGLNLGN